jgi:hypothetical protein
LAERAACREADCGSVGRIGAPRYSALEVSKGATARPCLDHLACCCVYCLVLFG